MNIHNVLETVAWWRLTAESGGVPETTSQPDSLFKVWYGMVWYSGL